MDQTDGVAADDRGGRRIGGETPSSRAAILDAAQALMIAQGYAAVSNRRVAAEAKVKPALVQYYFPTMDELFLALYRRSAQHSLDRQAQALAGPQPLHALWQLMGDTSRTGLAIEFMALARHRKVIQAEIAQFAKRSAALQREAIGRIFQRGGRSAASELPAGVAVLLVGSARALVMEEGLGIGEGHDQARAIVAQWLDTIEPPG